MQEADIDLACAATEHRASATAKVDPEIEISYR